MGHFHSPQASGHENQRALKEGRWTSRELEEKTVLGSNNVEGSLVAQRLEIQMCSTCQPSLPL